MDQNQLIRKMSMNYHVQSLISKINQVVQYNTSFKKIMKVRVRNVDYSIGKKGILKPTFAKRFIKNNYTDIQLQGKIYTVTITAGFNSKLVYINPC